MDMKKFNDILNEASSFDKYNTLAYKHIVAALNKLDDDGVYDFYENQYAFDGGRQTDLSIDDKRHALAQYFIKDFDPSSEYFSTDADVIEEFEEAIEIYL